MARVQLFEVAFNKSVDLKFSPFVFDSHAFAKRKNEIRQSWVPSLLKCCTESNSKKSPIDFVPADQIIRFTFYGNNYRC
jgi:hypothetical protein